MREADNKLEGDGTRRRHGESYPFLLAGASRDATAPRRSCAADSWLVRSMHA